MKLFILSLFFALFTTLSFGQDKFLTKQGKVSFFSKAPIEDIEADNDQVLSIINTSNGEIAISMSIKSFIFERSLMQEHFNENYLESDKYPKSIFKGQIQDFDNSQKTDQEVVIKGDLTIHGVTKKVEIQGKLSNMGDAISLKGSFKVQLVDYKIKIPKIVIKNIAETIKVTFNLDHKPYTK